jgi:hypothetical protein
MLARVIFLHRREAVDVVEPEIRSVAAASALAGFATMDTIGYIDEESPTRELRHAGSWKCF